MSLRLQCIQTIEKILDGKVFFSTLKTDFKTQDTAFANKLLLTALRRKAVIDKKLNILLIKKIPQKNKILNHILLLGATEILYMDTPTYAAINEYVNIAKKISGKFSANMVNAILHKVALCQNEMQKEVLFPDNFYQILKQDYTAQQINLMAQALLEEPPLDITPKENPEIWAKKLEGILFENGTIRLLHKTSVSSLDGYLEGTWWVQDLAAALPVCFLGDIKGKKVLDLCAAPGGKTAQLLAKGAIVTAIDINPERLKILEENINRLNLQQNPTTLCVDGLEYLKTTNCSFDIILLDAPCSATGTFRKHPETLYFKTLDDVKSLTQIQQQMLNAAAEHIAKGSQILYCTCSIAKAEGEEQIKHFLSTHTNFTIIPFQKESIKTCDGKIIDKNVIDKQVLRTLPYDMHEDGGLDSFFAARLARLI